MNRFTPQQYLGTRQRGISLVELIVALAIAATMMLFAIPAFDNFNTQRRITSSSNLIISAINYARSEAARRGVNVSVQAVDADDEDNEWGSGFCVTATAGDCDDPISVFAPENLVTIDATGANLNDEETWTFDPRGMITGGATGAIEICGRDAEDDPGRIIRISAIGRASMKDLVCFP